MGCWQEIDHTADLALQVWGEDLPDLFATAAQGMFALVARPDLQAEPLKRCVALEALDVETLLVDWLNELLYLYEVTMAVLDEVDFEALSATRLHATVRGRPAATQRAQIKAATFHNLEVVTSEAGVRTEIVFDI